MSVQIRKGNVSVGQTGGTTIGSNVGKFLVRFFDFDGTILKQEYVVLGNSASAPVVPTHQYLTFNSWNNSFTGVTSDIDTGAIYDTTDGKSYLFITLTTVTGLSPTLYLNKSTTSLMTVNWGDGTTSTSTTSGNQNLTHTYSSAGNYMITVDNSLGGTYAFGNGTTTTSCFYTSASILTILYLGKYISNTVAYGFNNHSSLVYVSNSALLSQTGTFRLCSNLIHLNVPNISGFNLLIYYLQACYMLRHVVFPNNISVRFASNTLDSCSTLQDFIIPSTMTIMADQSFQSCISLMKMDIPGGITILGDKEFSNCAHVIQYTFNPLTPPSISSNTFQSINPICKIYVPDASVNAYKAATNWSTYANYIYPLSTRPNQ